MKPSAWCDRGLSFSLVTARDIRAGVNGTAHSAAMAKKYGIPEDTAFGIWGMSTFAFEQCVCGAVGDEPTACMAYPCAR